jgi:putative transposase
MTFEFISKQRSRYGVLEMCEALEVSTSGYYRWEKAEPSEREVEDESLKERILEIHAQASGDYGYRPIYEHLLEEGYLCGRDRTLRLMNDLEVSGKQSKAYKPQGTDSVHDFGYSPNLFKELGETWNCDEVWVADTTYLLTDSGWMYLATVMDRHSRRILGWSVSRRNDRDLILEALKAAVMTRGTSVAGIHPPQRPRQHLRELRLSELPFRSRHEIEHEREGKLLRQRGHGILLRALQDRQRSGTDIPRRDGA